jgi:hypothetical protein
MTEDQSGQAWGEGYVVRGEVIAEGEPQNEQAAPVTYFHKVASGAHRTEPDPLAPTGHQDEVAAVTSPDALNADDEEDDADDDSTTRPMQVAAVTSPDALNADSGASDPGASDLAASDPAASDPAASDPAASDPAARDPGASDPGASDPGASDSDGGDGSGDRDYWDAPADDQDDVVPVTRADALASSAAATSAVPAVPVPAVPAAPVPVAPVAAVTAITPAADPSPVIAAPAPNSYGSLLPDTTDLRSQWQQIQFMFVDDPRASVTEAADVIDQVAARLMEAIQERQRSLRSRWDGGTQADTEALRETLRMYRAFLYQLIGSSGTPGS